MATRPSEDPRWADNNLHPAGSDDWSGQATKVEPSAGKKDGGFVPNSGLPAEELNWELNALGSKWIPYLDERRVVVEDDFTGDQLDRGQWKNVATGGDGAATFVQDAGGSGVYLLDAGSSGGAAFQTDELSLGTNPFELRARVKVAGVSSGTILALGVLVGTTNVEFIVHHSESTTEWRLFINNGIVEPTEPTALSGSYQDLVIRRDATGLKFFVNGDVIHEQAYTSNLDGAVFFISATVAPGKLYVDRAMLIIDD